MREGAKKVAEEMHKKMLEYKTPKEMTTWDVGDDDSLIDVLPKILSGEIDLSEVEIKDPKFKVTKLHNKLAHSSSSGKKSIEYKITIPKGTHGAFSVFKEDESFILPMNSRFRIDSVKKRESDSPAYTVHMTVLPYNK